MFYGVEEDGRSSRSPHGIVITGDNGLVLRCIIAYR